MSLIFSLPFLYFGQGKGAHMDVMGNSWVVCGDVIKINGVRAKPLIFVKVAYLFDMHKYM